MDFIVKQTSKKKKKKGLRIKIFLNNIFGVLSTSAVYANLFLWSWMSDAFQLISNH